MVPLLRCDAENLEIDGSFHVAIVVSPRARAGGPHDLLLYTADARERHTWLTEATHSAYLTVTRSR